MIETGGRPTIGVVTSSALRAEATGMRVILKMAGYTICRSFFEETILMTARAGNSSVFSIQLEGKLRMVNVGGFPGIRSMAARAGSSKLAFVEIIFLMAGIAILWGGFQVVEVAGVDVTARAGCLGVLPCQRKQNQVVIKG